jgi:malate synthase
LFALGDQATPRFAAQSTWNWMRSLSILVSNGDFSSTNLQAKWALVVEMRTLTQTQERSSVF